MKTTLFWGASVGRTPHSWVIDSHKWYVQIESPFIYTTPKYFWTKRGAQRFADHINEFYSKGE